MCSPFHRLFCCRCGGLSALSQGHRPQDQPDTWAGAAALGSAERDPRKSQVQPGQGQGVAMSLLISFKAVICCWNWAVAVISCSSLVAQCNAYEVSRLKENLEVLDFALDDEDGWKSIFLCHSTKHQQATIMLSIAGFKRKTSWIQGPK